MDIQERKTLLSREFRAHFGAEPLVWTQAPGRVDLMGSHTDYNQGFVLTQAIDRNTWIAARPRHDGRVVVRSLNLPGHAVMDLARISHERVTVWANYVFGVASILQQEGYRLTGFDGLIHSNIPTGGGLSSSAALEVASALLFDRLGELNIPPVAMARYCQRAENEFVGLDCGILDQYSSLMGREGCSLLLDCRELSSEVHPIARDISVMICDTRAVRALTGSEYAERRKQCEEGVAVLSSFYPHVLALRDVDSEQLAKHVADMHEIVFRRCKFVIEENGRVPAMARALTGGDVAGIRRLSEESFAGARDLYGISVPPMEKMMTAMGKAPGFIGGRQAGAGFGGCMVAFVEANQQEQFAQQVATEYGVGSGIEPAVYPVSASAGAGVLPI
jgi:galactokinase